MPSQEWMDTVNAWALNRAKLREKIKEHHDPEKQYQGGSYVMNLLIAIDQLGNALAAGNADETISSRIGKAKLKGNLSLVGKTLDILLDAIDDNHSIDAIEEDEGYPTLRTTD